jgi:cytoskeletal protein CcmA (bactofilin family)
MEGFGRTKGRIVEIRELEEDLIVGNGERVIAASDVPCARIRGSVRCRGRVEFAGKFECDNFSGDDCVVSIDSLSCHNLEIREGELLVRGDLICDSIDVDRKLVVQGITRCVDIDVGGVLELNTATARSIDVGGKLRASSDVEADDIDVGGLLEIAGQIRSKKLDVGGRALVGGGQIAEKIDVGGVFESKGPLRFGDIDVGGAVTLRGESSGGKIDIGGRLRAEGDIEFKSLDIGGLAEIRGAVRGESVRIGGRLQVGGSLTLTEDLDVGGDVTVEGFAKAKRVDVGRRLYAQSLEVTNGRLSGQVRTKTGVKASERIVVSHGSRIEGWIKAGMEIIIESKANVESVAAPRVVLEERARATNVYAEELIAEERAEILGVCMYTKSIRFEGISRSGMGPTKVDSIPQESSWV